MKGSAAIMMLLAVAAASGCGSGRTAPESRTQAPVPVLGVEGRVLGDSQADIPHAVAYRTDGDYADCVPVNLAPDGSLASYPAPSDISAASEPLPLVDGFLLDRRGIGPNTVFTRYTYRQYAALPQAPSQQQLLDSVIPGSRVNEMVVLPMTTSEALADTAAVNEYIRSRKGDMI